VTEHRPKGARTTFRTRTCAAALAIAAVTAAALPALALSSDAGAGGAQVVSGVVQDQFGAAVSADGTISSASTIPVSVTRMRENGVEIVTIVPLR
jgi:hypothetical protein